MYRCFKWRGPHMEEKLKLIKVEYLSIHWFDHTQILNKNYFKIWTVKYLGKDSADNTQLKLRGPNWNEQTLNENDNQLMTTSNYKMKYFSNHWLDLNQILNSRYGDKTEVNRSFKWRQPPIPGSSFLRMKSKTITVYCLG